MLVPFAPLSMVFPDLNSVPLSLTLRLVGFLAASVLDHLYTMIWTYKILSETHRILRLLHLTSAYKIPFTRDTNTSEIHSGGFHCMIWSHQKLYHSRLHTFAQWGVVIYMYILQMTNIDADVRMLKGASYTMLFHLPPNELKVSQTLSQTTCLLKPQQVQSLQT